MRSGRSSSSFSAALFLENIRRFWLLAAAGCVLYFLCAPFSMLSRLDSMPVYLVRDLLDHHNIGFLFFNVLMPLASAVAVFSYLNNTGSVNLLHSMPFSRKTLYVSNFLSGLALSELPFLINAVLVTILKRPLIAVEHYSYSLPAEQFYEYDIYTYPAIAKWALLNFVMILFIYALAVLGMQVSGNTVIGFLTAGAFNFLAAALLLCGEAYASMFLYGYTSSFDGLLDLAVKTNPLLYYAVNGNGIPARLSLLIYILIALLAAFLGYYAYTKRKLERAGESYVFRFMQHFVCFLLTFFAATIVGMLFNAVFGMNGGDGVNYAGLFLGGLVGFLIARMIVKTTPRVFNLESLKVFAVYAAAIALIVAGFAFDIFGYAKWQPKVADVQSATVWNPELNYYGSEPSYSFTEKENIELIESFQREVVECRKDPVIEGDSIQITYILNNGRRVQRNYFVNSSLVKDSEVLRTLYESEEVRGRADKITALDVSKFDVEVNDILGNSARYRSICNELSEQDKKELLQALASDMRSRTYIDMLVNDMILANIYLELRYSVPYGTEYPDAAFTEVPGYQYNSRISDLDPVSVSANSKVDYAASFNYALDSHCVNTIAWLEKHGIALDESVFEGCFVQVYNFNDIHGYYYEDMPVDVGEDLYETRWDPLQDIPESDATRIVFTDPEKAAELYLDYSTDVDYKGQNVENYKLIEVYKPVTEQGETWYEPSLFSYIDINNIPDWLSLEIDQHW